jgi:YbbR domain-containing protein
VTPADGRAVGADEPRRGAGALVKAALRAAFVDNAPLKFVALVLSLTIFILVHSDEDAVIGAYVKVSYTMPADRVLVSEPVDQVRITVKGPWRRIRRFEERSLEPIHLDLTSVRSGEFAFQDDMIKLPPGVELQSITPVTMRLTFEGRAEKSVPVTVATAGRPAHGYALEGVVATPSHVVIRGAETVVAATTTVRTRDVGVEGKT